MKRSSSIIMTALSALLLVLLPAPELGAFENTISLGAQTGYSSLYLRQPENVVSTSGSKSKINLFWGISDTIGVDASVSMAWYREYALLIAAPVVEENIMDETASDEEAEGIKYYYGNPITGISVQDFSLSLVYAFDVMRLTPYASAGVISSRIVETRENIKDTTHELGIRVNIGADYKLNEFFSFGAAVDFDTYLTQSSYYASQTSILLRASFIWPLNL